MSKIFGGSKSSSTQTSSSSNQAYRPVQQAFNPLLSYATSGADAYSKMLSGDTTGFDAFKDATGYDFALDRGIGNITNNAASQGMVRSGAAARALQEYGTGLNSQYAGSYLDRLLGQANLGFNAGQTMTGAGGVANSTGTSTSSSKPGLTGLVGAGASMFAKGSDERLKKNIHKIGKMLNGLNLYQYRYIDNSGPYIGVMAQEVEKIKPEALGPTISGYMTVNYSAL